MTGQASTIPNTAWLPLLAAAVAMCAAASSFADDSHSDIEQTSHAATRTAPQQKHLVEFTLDRTVSLVAGFYYPSEFCPESEFGAELNVPDVTSLYTPGIRLFTASNDLQRSLALVTLTQTDTFIDRLAELEKLEILPILRTDSASVYFGINREGRFGMHINSRE